MNTNKSDTPATYVMVHSAWLGGWAWGSVASLLEKQGHRVLAPDLPGHGKDKTPPSEVTLDAYLKTVTDVLDAQSDPVILVGHSQPSCREPPEQGQGVGVPMGLPPAERRVIHEGD